MKRLSLLIAAVLGVVCHTAFGAAFTPHNVVVLQCAGVSSGGNAGSLIEYSPSGLVVQTIAFPSTGSPAIVFGSTVALPHDISLSGDGALVVIPGYAQLAASIETTTSAANNRVIATVKWDGTVAYPIVNSALLSGQSPRGATSDGFGNFWVTFTSGMRYATPSAPTVSTTINGTGSRACAIFNGQLYASIAAGADSLSPNVPTSAASYVPYIAGATTADGFAIPAGPTVGSTAYIANYNDANGLYAFVWNGSSWNAPYAIKFTGIAGNIEHIAVDYSGASPVIFFTTTSGANNGLFKYVDTAGAGGTFAATTLASASGGAIFRGIAMTPTQPSAPVFSVNPLNQTNNYGGTIVFGPVSATGANPNGYTWKKGSTTLTDTTTPSGSIISGSTTPTLTISNITSADAGTYFAVASNNGGSATSSGAILALAGSSITTQLVNRTNVAGTTATFHVVSGGPAPLSYAWQQAGIALSDGPSPSGSGATISGSSTDTLTIAGVQDADAGSYTVTVTDNSSAQSVSSAILTVADQPGITTQPGNQSKIQGNTANFSVVATGNALAYQWFKGATPVTNGPTGFGSTNSGAQSANFSIANVKAGDAGSYTVTITNLAGSITSDPASLTVGVLPTVGTMSDHTNVVGSDAVFSVAVTGGTAPFTYTWRHNGALISDDGHFNGTTTPNLGITNVTVDDHRQFSVSVSNSYGGVTVSALLNVIIDTNKPNEIPNLIVYDPFNYPTGPATAPGFYSWENVISIYNRVTGQPAFWFNAGGGLNSGVVAWDPTSIYSSIARNGGYYPYPGIDCSALNRWTFAGSGNNNHLKFGGVTNGSVYFSFIFTGDQGSAVNNGTFDVIAGFTSGSSDVNGGNADTWNYKLCTKADVAPGEANPGNVDGPGGFRLGVFKGNGVAISAASVNGQFASPHLLRGHPYFIVGCYQINSGGTTTNDDVLSLWIEPARSTFGVSEANVPTPDAGGMITNWNNNAAITEFGIHCSAGLNGPFSKSISDLRIGKTWASVVRPYYPTLKMTRPSPDVTLAWPAKDSFGLGTVTDYPSGHYGYQLRSSTNVVGPYAFDSNDNNTQSGTNNVVTETPSSSPQFWQLIYPPRSGNFSTY